MSAVDSFLNPERPPSIPRGEIVIPKWATEDAGVKPQYVNLRLPRETIRTWDAACKQYYCTRAALLQQAVNWTLHFEEPRRFAGPVGSACKEILLHLVTTVGSLDFAHLAAIFQEWDPAALARVLASLEAEGLVMRKASETYVPAGGVDLTMGPRFVSGHLVLLADYLKSGVDPLGEEEAAQHRLLVQAMFEYLENYALLLSKMPATNRADLEGYVADLRKSMQK